MIYLLDYENVKNLTWIDELNNTDSVVIFYTKNANGLTFEEHLTLQQAKAKIEYKKVLTGNNALDFQLSSYLGFLIGQNFTDFCIVSKDNGYDSIVGFWKNEKNLKNRKKYFKFVFQHAKFENAQPPYSTPSMISSMTLRMSA